MANSNRKKARKLHEAKQAKKTEATKKAESTKKVKAAEEKREIWQTMYLHGKYHRAEE